MVGGFFPAAWGFFGFARLQAICGFGGAEEVVDAEAFAVIPRAAAIVPPAELLAVGVGGAEGIG